jgi:transcriptional regulator with XRE-family HTH domain
MSGFSDMLTFLRKREGYSQQELSEKLSVSRSAISMYESGKREPDYETLEELADFFNVNMSTLLGKTDIETIKPTPKSELSPRKQELFDLIDSLPDEKVEAILRLLGVE